MFNIKEFYLDFCMVKKLLPDSYKLEKIKGHATKEDLRMGRVTDKNYQGAFGAGYILYLPIEIS